MRLPSTWEECKSDWKALLRGEYRVQPGMRGPVYRRWKGEERPMVGHAKYKGGFIKPTRIWVDKDQRWYSVEEYLKRKGDA